MEPNQRPRPWGAVRLGRACGAGEGRRIRRGWTSLVHDGNGGFQVRIQRQHLLLNYLLCTRGKRSGLSGQPRRCSRRFNAGQRAEPAGTTDGLRSPASIFGSIISRADMESPSANESACSMFPSPNSASDGPVSVVPATSYSARRHLGQAKIRGLPRYDDLCAQFCCSQVSGQPGALPRKKCERRSACGSQVKMV